MVMKKICILLFTAVAFVACNKVSETIINEPVEVPVNNDIPAGYHLVTLSAAQAEAVDEDTKTTYANDKVFSWTSGDEISVLFNDGSTNRFFTFSTTGTGASATFTGLVEDGFDYEGSVGGTKWALFPANDNHVYTSDTDIKFFLPTGTNGNVCNIPMIANYSESTYRFYHLCGALKFTFRGLTANQNLKFQFNSHNDKRRTYGLYEIQGLSSGISSAIIQGNHVTDYYNHSAWNTTYVTAQADAKGVAVLYLPLPLSETSTTNSEYWPTYELNLLNAADDSNLYSITTGHFNIAKGKMTIVSPKQLGTEPLGGITIDGTFSDWDVHTERYVGGTLGVMKATSDRTNLYIYQRFINSNFTYSIWDNYQYIYVDIDNDDTSGCTEEDAYQKGADRRWKFFIYFDDPSCPDYYNPDEATPFAKWSSGWSKIALEGFDETTMYKAVKTTDYLDIEYCIPLSSLSISPDPSTTKVFSLGLYGHYKDGTPSTVYPKTKRLAITIPAPSE